MKSSPSLSARTAGSLRCLDLRYGPWVCKKRPAGDWVVDQYDRQEQKIRRFGPFPTEADARAVYAELVPPAQID